MFRTAFVYRDESRPTAWLDAVWTVDVQHDCSSPLRYRTLPDGCIDLIYRLKRDVSGRVDAASLIAVGATDRPDTFYPMAGEEFIGVRFALGWGGFALGLCAREIAGNVITATDLNAKLARLERHLFDCRSKQQATNLMRSIGDAWASENLSNRRTIAAVNALRMSGGRLTVDEIAKFAGVSTRTFLQDVREATGLSSKVLARIFRFRQALNRIESGNGSALIDLALDAGYSDQAHMTREFRSLGGFTPGFEHTCTGRSEDAWRIR